MSVDNPLGGAITASPGATKRLVLFIKSFVASAGAKTESASKRDGFLSYHAESHALGMGIAAGWFFAATGRTELLGMVYAAAVYGKAHEVNGGKRRRILEDVRQEWHYALGGVVLGAVLGGGSSIAIEVLTRIVAI